jgi:hypothetical protein
MFFVSLVIAVTVLVLSVQSADAEAIEPIVIIARASERLIVALAGVFSLWIGYKLFSAIGEKRIDLPAASTWPSEGAIAAEVGKGQFEAKLGELVNVKLAEVGPGIFFALFGALLLGYLISSRVEVGGGNVAPKPSTSSDQPSDSQKPGIKFETLANTPTNKERTKQVIQAIRTVRAYGAGNATTNETKQRYENAVQSLSAAVPDLIDVSFGSGAYAKYTKLRQQDKVGDADRKEYEEIDGILNGGL